jgi:regulatory protein
MLAQREHSRAELRRKLLPVARAVLAALDDTLDPAACREGAAAQVDELLDWLEAHQYLSQARFVESRVHARAARFGSRRIEQELAQHGVALDAGARQRLRETELERARDVWRRKYGRGETPPAAADPAERARQMRFLAARGFSADVVQRVVRGGGGDADD